ncbi:unnamed protein product [Fusarium equiseti]|uniref:VCBS repeat-containing protein n=1 Tax=Fusarium equiseti TaxID=61235 RepID=A0A8J2II56_FUSEQ|nr:unnamed protein product [Fusarium equiseti]
MIRETPQNLASFYLSRLWHNPAIQAIASATIFLVAIIALLIVDVYHTARRLCTAAGYDHSFWNLFPHIFTRGPRDYHYRWSIGKMVKIHLEDAILIGLYILIVNQVGKQVCSSLRAIEVVKNRPKAEYPDTVCKCNEYLFTVWPHVSDFSVVECCDRGTGGLGFFSLEVVSRAWFLNESPWDRRRWRFARLFNPLHDDLLGWYDYTANDHRFGVWKNSANGQGTFTRIGDLIDNIYCIPRGLHFADVNADGLDDIICVSPSSDLRMSLNQGNGNGEKPLSFKYIGLIKSGEGHQDRVRLADIDDDDRVDYGIVADNGHVTFWRNGGNGEKPEFWQKLGVKATMAPTESG